MRSKFAKVLLSLQERQDILEWRSLTVCMYIFVLSSKFQQSLRSYGKFSQVPLEDLREASEALVKALTIREKYLSMAMQSFPRITHRFLQSVQKVSTIRRKEEGKFLSEEKVSIQGEHWVPCCLSDSCTLMPLLVLRRSALLEINLEKLRMWHHINIPRLVSDGIIHIIMGRKYKMEACSIWSLSDNVALPLSVLLAYGLCWRMPYHIGWCCINHRDWIDAWLSSCILPTVSRACPGDCSGNVWGPQRYPVL